MKKSSAAFTLQFRLRKTNNAEIANICNGQQQHGRLDLLTLIYSWKAGFDL